MNATTPPPETVPVARESLYYRHRLPVRVMHWVNVVALTILLMSGLNIFDAHPALYWGDSSYTGRGPLLVIGANMTPEAGFHGITMVFGRAFDTTGVLGASKDREGELTNRAFPWWLTIPDNRWLSMARSWHFFFAWILVLNGLVYFAWSLGSRHLTHDLAPDGATCARFRSRSAIICASAIRPASGETLQRAAEDHLSRRDLRACPACDPDGPRDVAAGGCDMAGLGRSLWRPAVGAHDPLHCRVDNRSVRADPRVRSDRLGVLEPSAFDDHRAVSCAIGSRP
jgi:thiosulfate reductase cytochrome b subunit